MKSNYRKIGELIRLVDERNVGLKVTTLLGLSISKEFIPSVANIIGTDMENYKIIRKDQFACSLMQVRRDKKIPVALLRNREEAIISQAYPVFEVINRDILLPEYLMMWFSREEFDRESCFYAVGGVRGSLEWSDFCDMELPIPSIEKQKEIVTEYNILVNRINLNNTLIEKLEDTAQTLYKQWFVDFEFPDLEGNPYKSSGGEMIESEMGEIPKGWESGNIGKLIAEVNGGDWGDSKINGNYNLKVRCIRGTDIPSFKIGQTGESPIRYILPKNKDTKILYAGYIVIEISGGSEIQSTGRTILITEDQLAYSKEPVICSNFCKAISLKDINYSEYFYSIMNYLYKLDVLYNFENSTIGLKNFDLNAFMEEQLIVFPAKEIVISYNAYYGILLKKIFNLGRQNETIIKNINVIMADLFFNKET